MTALPRRAFAAFAIAVAAGAGHAAGLDLHTDADAADIGVPAYPGAIKKTDLDGDRSGFSFGVWGASFGFKVAAVSYHSIDSVDKVAAFYRDALARYGAVLDCSRNRKGAGSAHVDFSDQADRDQPVTCGDDGAEAGGRLYKVGTKGAQRIVKVKPWHDGASFELLRVEEHRGD